MNETFCEEFMDHTLQWWTEELISITECIKYNREIKANMDQHAWRKMSSLIKTVIKENSIGKLRLRW